MEKPPQVLLDQIYEKQEQEKVLTEEWTEKWRETQQILQEQKALGLRKSGVGVVLDSEMPHLVGIDDNLLSTGVTLYHLKEGKTLVGTEEAPTVQVTILKNKYSKGINTGNIFLAYVSCITCFRKLSIVVGRLEKRYF